MRQLDRIDAFSWHDPNDDCHTLQIEIERTIRARNKLAKLSRRWIQLPDRMKGYTGGVARTSQ